MNFKEIINDIGSKAKKASLKLRTLNADKKKIAYECLEENINNKAKDILKANQIDIENAPPPIHSFSYLNRGSCYYELFKYELAINDNFNQFISSLRTVDINV